jgi:hypothetical protein
MSERIIKLNTSAHQAVQELLPWFAADALREEERIFVQRHLQACSQCQSDAEWQRKLQAAIRMESATTLDADRALARLRPMLYARPPEEERAVSIPWMKWILAGQAAAIAVLVACLVMPSYFAPASYRGLSSSANDAADIVAVFKPETTQRELQLILGDSGARLAGGPTETGAYLLSVPPARLEKALAALHAEKSVVLAEPLTSGAPR